MAQISPQWMKKTKSTSPGDREKEEKEPERKESTTVDGSRISDSQGPEDEWHIFTEK